MKAVKVRHLALPAAVGLVLMMAVVLTVAAREAESVNRLAALPAANDAPQMAASGLGALAPLSQTEPSECPFPVPLAETVGETIECGTLQVPENWEAPDGRQLTISYAVLKSPSVSPFPDPVVYLEGGPGSSALAGLPNLSEVFSELRQYRDIVLYDQRGTNYSTPLVCPQELASQPLEDVPQDAEPPASVTADIADFEAAARVGSSYATAVNCAPYFEEQGIDLSQYSTANSVQDLIALMAALDYSAYNIYGISYGTNVALELFRYYDENDPAALPAIRSGVIDGNVPPNVDTRGGQAYGAAYSVLRLFADCEEDAACGAAFPDIRQRAIDLMQQAAETPLVVGEETISATDLASLMRSALIFKLDEAGEIAGYAAPYLPLMIDELERGVADTYIGLRDGALPPEPESAPPAASPLGSVAGNAATLAEDARSLAERIEQLSLQSRREAEALENGLPLPEFFLSELRLAVTNLDSTTAAFFPVVVQISLQSETERDALLGIAAGAGEQVAALVPLMSDEEVSAALRLVTEALPELKSFDEIANIAITCNDRYASLDLERIFAEYRAFDVPELLNPIDTAANEKAACEAWGLTPEDSDLTDPVTSALPILVSNGSMDQQTPVEWGEAAAEGLSNATLVTFTYAQHGASTQFECGPAVANAFIMYPDQVPATDCAGALRLQFPFVLPGQN